MKLLIRYLGVVLVDKELEPGEYVIGRSPDVDILLTQDFISRKHGKVFSQEGKWFYQDLRDKHSKKPVEITDAAMIELENDIDLLTEPFLFAEDTGEYDIRDLKTMSKRMRRNRRRITVVATALAITLALAGGGYAYYITSRPMDPNALLAFVRPKVVELERAQDDKAIRDLKTYAKIEDSELRDSVSFCSGFIVAPEVVLTASHCLHGRAFIDMDLRFKIKTHDDKLHLPHRVLGFDAKRDYAYVEVPGLRGYDELEFTTRHQVGDTVYTIGNVQGQGIAIRDGILASMTKDASRPEIEYLRYSAAASPGNSGGPLVDGFGRVVGIVFARTQAENYNLATAAGELLEGKGRFVDNLESKKVSLHLKDDLEVPGAVMVEQLGLPLMSVWGEDPETLRPLDELTVEIEVPVPLAEYPPAAVAAFSAVLSAAHAELVAKAKTDGELEEGSWTAHVSETVPLIPVAQPGLQQRGGHEKLPNGAIAGRRIGLLTPCGHKAYESFVEAVKEDEPVAYPVEVQPMMREEKKEEDEDKEEGDAEKSVVVYRNMSFGKINLMFMGRRPAAVLVVDYDNDDLDQVRRPPYHELLADLTGKEGVEAHTAMSPMVRPTARRPFLIKKLEEEAEPEAVTDASGRTWLRYGVPMLGVGILESHCLPLPQGRMCLHNLRSDDNPALTATLRANRLQNELSPIIVEPLFWEVDALVDYFGSGAAAKLRTMKDFELEVRASGALVVRLSSLGLRFTIPAREQPTMLRLNSGLHRRGDGSSGWTALGFEAYFPDENQVCTVGAELEVEHVAARAFRTDLWDWLTTGRPLGKGKVSMTRTRSKKLDAPMVVFATCEDVEVGSPFAWSYSMRPYKIKHAIE